MNIRNFSIIAHIDHGKSTLADRILEYTGTVADRNKKDQILDSMDLERERGITIKAKPVRIKYSSPQGEYILNLIDTPGHVDFSYEVSRALSACEGAILLVDAGKGVEAQTMANATLCQDLGLKIIPVINKIDLQNANIEEAVRQLKELLNIEEEPILASAKTGQGISEILEAVINKIPSPAQETEKPLSALIFDSYYDTFRGVVIYVRVIEGMITAGLPVRMFFHGTEHEVLETGARVLDLEKQKYIPAGSVGYVICGIKSIQDVKIGDTLTERDRPTRFPHPGFKEIKPFVFAGFYSINPKDYNSLKAAFEKLRLNDSSFNFTPESSDSLGFGFRCGFLGMLHMEIIKERLEREFSLHLIVTAPNVLYKVKMKSGEEVSFDNPSKFPDHGKLETVYEPYIRASLITPKEFVGGVMQYAETRRGIFKNMKYVSLTKALLIYEMPLSETITDFYSRLKSLTKGYATFDYEHIGYREGDLVKVKILINNAEIDSFSMVSHKAVAYEKGRKLIEKLREIIPRQMFEVPIQVAVSGKIIARESIRAIKKDVLAKCYGGDISRKRKLIEKQKEGKKKMKMLGRVEIPQEAFMSVLKLELE